MILLECCRRRRQCRGAVVSVILCPGCPSCQCPIQPSRRCVAEPVSKTVAEEGAVFLRGVARGHSESGQCPSHCPSQCPSQRAASEWSYVSHCESEGPRFRQRHGDCAPPPAPTPQAEPESGECVWKSRFGRRYHKRSSCRALRGTDPTSLTLSQAQAAGLTPCRICSQCGG